MLSNVVAIAYPGVATFGLGVTAEVFGKATDGLPRFRYQVAGTRRGEMRTDTGMRFRADAGLDAVASADLAIMVCWREQEPPPPALLRALRATVAGGGRVMSHCTGAFVLAAAGLLDGRRATTHWAWCDEFADRFPAVTVDADPIFVRDGNVWTSAGVTAGMDLALALVDEDLGRDVALMTARQLVLFVQRPGGQSQFSAQLGAQVAARQPLRELQHWIVEHPDADLSVDRLATHVAMSPRHFARVFREEVGATPAVYVESVRVEVARRLLETTDYAVDEVARTAGFGTAETIRRAFARRVGASPSEYRDRFRPSRAS
jgi:transcriptional regulator GlxA family with amidase domain